MGVDSEKDVIAYSTIPIKLRWYPAVPWSFLALSWMVLIVHDRFIGTTDSTESFWIPIVLAICGAAVSVCCLWHFRDRGWPRFLVICALAGNAAFSGWQGWEQAPPRITPNQVRAAMLCKSRMFDLASRILTYASAHGGQFPTSLKDVSAFGDFNLEPNLDQCPGVPGGPPAGYYIYYGQGKLATASPPFVVLSENPANHYDAMNVCYSDGTYDTFFNRQADRVARELANGLNPPPSSGNKQ